MFGCGQRVLGEDDVGLWKRWIGIVVVVVVVVGISLGWIWMRGSIISNSC